MFPLLKKNKAFFIPYFLFLLAGGIILILWSKTDITLFINRHNNPLADLFFSDWTNLGLGVMIIPVVLILAFIRFRYVIISLIGFLVTVIITESLKFWFHAPRPKVVFDQIHQQLYFVPNVTVLSWNSFPSGHTATSFCIFSLLAIYSKNNFLKLLWFVIAFLIAYSRMYLSEHFLKDVYAASIIGTGSSVFAYIWVMRSHRFNKFAERLDKPLLSFHRKK